MMPVEGWDCVLWANTLLKTLCDRSMSYTKMTITHKKMALALIRVSFNPTSDYLMIPMDTYIMVLWCGFSYMYYSSPAANRQSLMVHVNTHGAALALIYTEESPIPHIKHVLFFCKRPSSFSKIHSPTPLKNLQLQ